MNALVPSDPNSAMALANMMATGKLVPQHLQRSPGDCLLVIEQAMRWGMSPFAVAQCTSVIHGRLMFQGQLVAAALHTSGIMSGRLHYTFDGKGDDRTVTVSGTIKGEDQPSVLSVRLKDVVTDNQIWRKQPDQQLVYRGIRDWARRYASEVMLGVYAPEDFDERPSNAAGKFTGHTIEAKAETAGEAIGDSVEHLTAPETDKAAIGARQLIEKFDACESPIMLTALTVDPKIRTQREWLKDNRPLLSANVERAATDAAERINEGRADEPFPGDTPLPEGVAP